MVQIIALVAHAVRRRETAATRSEEGVLSGFGTADGEEVRNEQLLIAKYKRRTLRDEFDYDHPEQCIKLDDREEITRLKALLNREFPETGRYSLAQADAHSAINQAVSALSADGKADANAIHQLVQALADIAGAENLIRPGHHHFDHWDEIRRGDRLSDSQRSGNPRRQVARAGSGRG